MVLKEAQMPGFEPIPYRIRIGVTGHRALEHTEQIAALVKEALKETIWSLFTDDAAPFVARARKNEVTPGSFSILSPLAEGADRIVARAILEYPEARLDVVLPLVVEDYLEDFATDESKQEFRELLNQSASTVFIRTRRIRDDCPDPAGQAELRLDAYEQVGRYVVDHCDVLIAVWDGRPSRVRGGTAEIVRYALSRNRPILRVWEDQEAALP
jgi:hypothetical protein